MYREMLPRILPFALFMAVIGIEQSCSFLIGRGVLHLDEQILLYFYPLRVALAGAALLFYRRQYTELRFRDIAAARYSLFSIGAGLLVFALWINMDWTLFGGESRGFDPTDLGPDALRSAMIGVRLFGAAIVVPVMEELFWRSFLTRYLIRNAFLKVPLGTFTVMSFTVSAVLFGLEHHLVLAGVMAGIAYNFLLMRTKSLFQCILAHGVTNLALGVYVLLTGNWHFW